MRRSSPKVPALPVRHESDITIRFHCGALLRRQIREALERMMFDLPREVQGRWREDTTLLYSQFSVRFIGPHEEVDEQTETVQALVRRVGRR